MEIPEFYSRQFLWKTVQIFGFANNVGLEDYQTKYIG